MFDGRSVTITFFFFHCVFVRVRFTRGTRPSSGQNALFYRCSSDRHWPRQVYFFPDALRYERRAAVSAHLLPVRTPEQISAWDVWKSIPVRHIVRGRGKKIRNDVAVKRRGRFRRRRSLRGTTVVNAIAVKGGRMRLSPRARAGFMDDVLNATDGPGAWRPWFLSHAHPAVPRTVKTFSSPFRFHRPRKRHTCCTQTTVTAEHDYNCCYFFAPVARRRRRRASVIPTDNIQHTVRAFGATANGRNAIVTIATVLRIVRKFEKSAVKRLDKKKCLAPVTNRRATYRVTTRHRRPVCTADRTNTQRWLAPGPARGLTRPETQSFHRSWFFAFSRRRSCVEILFFQLQLQPTTHFWRSSNREKFVPQLIASNGVAANNLPGWQYG